MNSFLGFCCLLLACALPGNGQRRDRHTVRMRLGTTCHGRYYGGLGCFSNLSPFTNTDYIPQSPRIISTTFLLYTRQNPTQPQNLNALLRSSIRSSNLDSSLPVKVLIHGFLQNGQIEFLRNMTQAFLNAAPMNVIVVGWANGAALPYSQAVANTRVVGAETARLLQTLVRDRQVRLSLDNVHLIGHSLGAHVAGYVGARVQGIARITALDPAQPNFSGFPPAVRLDPSDARFVDVIHTDGVPYGTVRGYGMVEPVGHVDFYPNGGHEQPGCLEDRSVMDFLEDAISSGITRAETDLSCSHERSTALFTASIILDNGPCAFKAFPCASETDFARGRCLDCGNRPCPEMGLHAASSHGARGRYFLNTTAQHPFCGHHHFVKASLVPSNSEMGGTLMVRLRGSLGQTGWLDLRPDSEQNVHMGLLLSESDIGEVQGVDLHFREASSFLPWSTQPVDLNRVEVNCPMRYPTKYFCQQTMQVEANGDLALNNGTFSEASCPIPSNP